MALKFYYDLMSPPSRALYILLKNSKCKFESKQIRLAKQEQLSKEFSAINRFQKVPVIDHNGFILTESVAIARYLFQEKLVPDNFYGKNSKEMARVDEFMEWQHIGLKMHCGLFFIEASLKPFFTREPADKKAVKMYKKNMEDALEDFQKYWLKNGTKFVSGNNVTIADLLAACDLEQVRLGGYDAAKNFEKIGTWLKEVREICNPHYGEAHIYLDKALERLTKIAQS